MPRVLSGGARTSMGRRHAGCGDTIGPHNRMDGWMFIQYAKESNGYIHIFLSSVLCAGGTRSLVSHMIMKNRRVYCTAYQRNSQQRESTRVGDESRKSFCCSFGQHPLLEGYPGLQQRARWKSSFPVRHPHMRRDKTAGKHKAVSRLTAIWTYPVVQHSGVSRS